MNREALRAVCASVNAHANNAADGDPDAVAYVSVITLRDWARQIEAALAWSEEEREALERVCGNNGWMQWVEDCESHPNKGDIAAIHTLRRMIEEGK